MGERFGARRAKEGSGVELREWSEERKRVEWSGVESRGVRKSWDIKGWKCQRWREGKEGILIWAGKKTPRLMVVITIQLKNGKNRFYEVYRCLCIQPILRK